MTQHTLKYIHKKRGYCKGEYKTEEEVKTIKEPPGLVKPTKPTTSITEETVNTYIKENPDTVTKYLRNERVTYENTEEANECKVLIQ